MTVNVECEGDGYFWCGEAEVKVHWCEDDNGSWSFDSDWTILRVEGHLYNDVPDFERAFLIENEREVPNWMRAAIEEELEDIERD